MHVTKHYPENSFHENVISVIWPALYSTKLYSQIHWNSTKLDHSHSIFFFLHIIRSKIIAKGAVKPYLTM